MDHSEMTTKKQRRLVTSCTENMQQLQDVHLEMFIFTSGALENDNLHKFHVRHCQTFTYKVAK